MVETVTVNDPLLNIFVFASNLAGRHGRGSALEARKHHGAIYGKGVGLQGFSYAIPTKDKDLNVLPINTIKQYVDEFIEFANNHPEYTFNIVKIGCGLSGYKEEEMAPLFKESPKNCNLPVGWEIWQKA